jgi:hypothetical protein
MAWSLVRELLWRCLSCKRVYTPDPPALHNKTYPLRLILSALSDYHLGFTLEETAARLLKKATDPRTSTWGPIFLIPYERLFAGASSTSFGPPARTID